MVSQLPHGGAAAATAIKEPDHRAQADAWFREGDFADEGDDDGDGNGLHADDHLPRVWPPRLLLAWMSIRVHCTISIGVDVVAFLVAA